MRLTSTKITLFFLTVFTVLITRASAHHDWENFHHSADDGCEDENHGLGQNGGYYGDQPNNAPYGRDASSAVPYPAPTAYPPQVPGPAQSIPFPPTQPPSRTDLPGLHPPEQNSASESSMLISFTLCSVFTYITMALIF
ncbi:hypothetical protein K501DRAFT_272715 [Backusella circina FSU 941]|nr:hypothetical protein K501DRAFT_272715 [Backusella circina FSU 941]